VTADLTPDPLAAALQEWICWLQSGNAVNTTGEARAILARHGLAVVPVEQATDIARAWQRVEAGDARCASFSRDILTLGEAIQHLHAVAVQTGAILAAAQKEAARDE
jgi:hypothetical protein